MKIVHLCLDAVFADGFSYQENILPKYHVKQGHDVTVIASLVSFDSHGKKCILSASGEYSDPNGYKVIRLLYRRPRSINKAFRYYIGLEKALYIESPDIIFSHNLGFGDTNIVANYLKTHPNVKFYCDNHADYINTGTNLVNRQLFNYTIRAYYAKKLIPYIHKCFGVTPMRCRYVRDIYGMPDKLVEFLPMGVDDDAIPQDREKVRSRIRQEMSISESDFVVFTGGKIDKLKNTHVLIEAIRRLDNPNVHLLICGVLMSDMEYLNDIIKELPNIHYLGWCDSEKVMDCMVSADLACFPGTHSTLWEQSVGVGIPAVFKRWDEMEHVNVNGNCIFVRGDDVEEILNNLESLIKLENYNLIKRLALEASRSFLYSNISVKAISS